jgi:hypothetical protein
VRSINREFKGVQIAEIRDDCEFNANLHPLLTDSEIEYPTRRADCEGVRTLRFRELSVVRSHASACGLHLVDSNTGERVLPLDLGFMNPLMRRPVFRILSRFQPPNSCSLPVEFALADFHRLQANGKNRVTHSPRLHFGDRIVVARERWRVPAMVVPEGYPGESTASFFRRINAWRSAEGIPLSVYARVFTPTERRETEVRQHRRRVHRDQKPQYINFGSIGSLHLLRRLTAIPENVILLEEALPDFGDSFEIAGAMRCAELFVQLDDLGPRSS